MKIHEYQAKEIFLRYGVPVPKGHLAQSALEARVEGMNRLTAAEPPRAVVELRIGREDLFGDAMGLTGIQKVRVVDLVLIHRPPVLDGAQAGLQFAEIDAHLKWRTNRHRRRSWRR